MPDLLDEIKWELDWLLKMQDKDGGVYNRVAGRSFNSGPDPPELGQAAAILYRQDHLGDRHGGGELRARGTRLRWVRPGLCGLFGSDCATPRSGPGRIWKRTRR